MAKYFTGIGSRKTPETICDRMTDIADLLTSDPHGYTLRSGGADGADLAFEAGAREDRMEIYLPWPGFNGRTQNNEQITDWPLNLIDTQLLDSAEAMVKEVHPAWDRCSQGARKLHIRNAFQLLGRDLWTPSEVVICWTKNGEAVGGTATCINLAKKRGIPIWNLDN